MKYKILTAAVILILIAGIIGSVMAFNAPAKTFVRVVSDGRTVYSGDLMTAEDKTFDVEYRGHVNTVEIRGHKIRVKSADCPDQTCVNMGELKSSAMPIVCLPHKLVIEFFDSGDGMDAVTR